MIVTRAKHDATEQKNGNIIINEAWLWVQALSQCLGLYFSMVNTYRNERVFLRMHLIQR